MAHKVVLVVGSGKSSLIVEKIMKANNLPQRSQEVLVPDRPLSNSEEFQKLLDIEIGKLTK